MKREDLKGRVCATAIGSVPHTDPGAVVDRILEAYKDIPFWPQMPKRSFFENMYVQYMEGFPRAVIDEDKKKVWIDTTKGLMGEIERAYQKIIEEDIEYFSISDRYAAGLYEFLSRAGGCVGEGTLAVKGHVTGPVSFGLSVTDEKKQSILYNRELSEVLTGILAMKARWQIKRLNKICQNVIIFIDEPYLVSVGSSVVNIKREAVISRISAVISAIHAEGALAGIHCCGNTDWSILLGMDLDILNFDAYNFARSLALYPEDIKGFLKAGGTLAWGIVPTSDGREDAGEGDLSEALAAGIGGLQEKGIERGDVTGSMILTPSCGCGTLSEDEADKILALNAGLADTVRRLYGK